MTVRLPADLRGLELVVTRRLEGLLQGDHRGLLPGPGYEPGDARVYEPGDDVRRIDWNVTARTSRLHVRDTVADRELELILAVDRSASMAFGTAGPKEDVALAAAATFGFLAQRGGNRIGAATLEPGGRVGWLRPRAGRDHFLGLLSRLARPVAREGSGPGRLDAALARVARLARRRGMVVVVSDFLDPGPWERSLRQVAARHETVAVEVVDPWEVELPAMGVVTFSDPETGRRRTVDTARLGRRYREEAKRRTSDVHRRILRSGAHHLRLRTDRDWLRDVLSFAVDRRRAARTVGRQM